MYGLFLSLYFDMWCAKQNTKLCCPESGTAFHIGKGGSGFTCLGWHRGPELLSVGVWECWRGPKFRLNVKSQILNGKNKCQWWKYITWHFIALFVSGNLFIWDALVLQVLADRSLEHFPLTIMKNESSLRAPTNAKQYDYLNITINFSNVVRPWKLRVSLLRDSFQ